MTPRIWRRIALALLLLGAMTGLQAVPAWAQPAPEIPTDDPPLVPSPFVLPVDEMTAESPALLDSDLDLSSLWWSFGDGQSGTGATASHTYAAGGTPTVTLTVTDSVTQTASTSHTLVMNGSPYLRDDTWATPANQPTNIPYGSLLQNDYDPDGDSLTVTAVNPSGLAGSLDCSFGTYCRFTPNPNLVGVTSFAYTASDGKGGTAVATVRVKVGLGNSAPALQDVLLETAKNTPLVFTRATLLVNDSDPDGDVLSVLGVFPPGLTAQGTVACSAAYYICTYTPPTGFTGVDVLTYRVSDGITTVDAHLRILVRPPARRGSTRARTRSSSPRAEPS